MIMSKFAIFAWVAFACTLMLTRDGSSQEFIGPHGYLTFEAEISNKDSVGERGTFDLHHLNIIGNFLLDSKTRVFGEIEWEHGIDTEAEGQNGKGIGFVRVERAWFEVVLSDQLAFRLGKFLTPYGIYNEIHDAAPAYDTSILPTSIYGQHENPFGQQQRFYAKFSIGIQALGKLEFGGLGLDYQAFVSNGRGSKPFEQDDNGNKGIGFRLESDIAAAGLKLGYSLYTDRNGLANNTRQTSHAWDVRFEHKRWRLSGEVALSRLGRGKAAAHDQVANAGYGELAYHLFRRQTVLVRYDIFDADRRRSGDLEKDLTLGMSIQASQKVVVKSEVHFLHAENAARQDFVLAIASLAVVF